MDINLKKHHKLHGPPQYVSKTLILKNNLINIVEIV